jgi:4-hydroxybenzoate polyprenyltransferase
MGNAKPNLLFLLTEFRRFIRVETCLVVSCIALSGYLIFNTCSPNMIFLFLAVFFATGASYAYNHLTDKEEDIVNNSRLNIFVASGWGQFAILVCMAISLFSALHLSTLSLTIYLISIVAGFAYSFFRIKRFPVKAIYSGFFLSLPFLIGAVVENHFIAEMIPYFLLIFLIGFTGNLLGDIRGYSGDMLAGLKTIPVMLGVDLSKSIVYLNLGLFSFFSIMLGYFMFMPMIPLLVAASLFLNRDNHAMARSSIMSTFFILVSVLVFMKVLGV